MKLALRAQVISKKVTLMATAFVLAVSSLTASVPFILSQNASAIARTGVSDKFELQDALQDPTVDYIELDADITSDEEFVLSRSNVTIQGNDKSITFTGDADGWQGNYVLQIYKATGVSINSIRLHGADAGLLINGSTVVLTGHTWVNGNEFGGIELAKGSGVSTHPRLIVPSGFTFSIQNGVESPTYPTLWADESQTTGYQVSTDLLYRADAQGPNQSRPYYLNFANTGNSLAAPQPTGPQNGATIKDDKRAAFTWQSVANATQYEVRYSQSPGRSPNANNGQLNSSDAVNLPLVSTNSQTFELPGYGAWFWQVRSVNGPVKSDWSNIWSTTRVETVRVSTDAMNGWMINTGLSDVNATESGGQVSFNTVAAPLSAGAIQLSTSDSNDARVRVTKPVDVKLSAVREIAFDSKQLAGPLNSANASFRLGLDNDGNGSIDQSIVYETYYNGENQANVWQTWNVKNGKFWGSWNPGGGYATNKSLSEIPGTTPNTVIRSISVGLGNWNPSWQILVDNVRFHNTVYDFEADVTSPDVPTINYFQDSNGATVTSNGATNSKFFTFNLASSADTTRYQLQYSNTIPGAAVQSWNPSDLASHSTSLGVYKDNFTQGEGTHYFAFSACDAAGNCSNFSEPFVVTYDNTDPIATVVDGNYLTTDTQQRISGTAEVGSIIKLMVGDEVVASGIVPALDGTWFYDLLTNRPLGNYALLVTATDAAGNESNASATLTVANPTPVSPNLPVEPGIPVSAPSDEDENGDASTNTGSLLNNGLPLTTLGVQQVLGDSTTDTEADDNTGNPAVEGVSTQNNVAQAVDSDSNEGRLWGLAWYWWILILAGIALLGWWIAAAVRRRREQN